MFINSEKTNKAYPIPVEEHRGMTLSKTSLIIMLAVLLTLTAGAVFSNMLLSKMVNKAEQARDMHIPQALNTQRSVMKLERLARFGEIIYRARSEEVRRYNRLAATLLIQNLSFYLDADSEEEANKIYTNLSIIDNIRKEQQSKISGEFIYESFGKFLGKVQAHTVKAPEPPKDATDEPVLDTVYDPETGEEVDRQKKLFAQQTALIAKTYTKLHQSLNNCFEDSSEDKKLLEEYMQRIDLAGRTMEKRAWPEQFTTDFIQLEKEARARLNACSEIYTLEKQAEEHWNSVNTLLGSMINELHNDAAITATKVTDSIIAETDGSRRIFLITNTVLILICLLTMLGLRHHILRPVLEITNALKTLYQKKSATITLPRTLFQELDAIGRAVERYSWTLAELTEANQQLLTISQLDGLTNIANRRYFDLTLKQELQRSKRNQRPLSLLMLDIDYFKHFNDTYGHMAGDDCLKLLARVLSQAARRSGDLAARYGGEEFVVILPETKEDEAILLAERIRSQVALVPVPCGQGQVMNITISIGVASIIPHAETTGADMIQAADQALYKAKRQGRNQVQVYTPSIDKET